ncbi:hypothetical protein FRC0481_02234 [Corynebacterium diphtheriae]|nr:hypothetical protein FRC0480_02231 [Corynebacterium diphtheriae]CAB0979569.1 hypothetical protein FRC0481_02234 [Corynebacterium diphtheriae]
MQKTHSLTDKRWWSALATVVIASFVVLLWMGQQINIHKPPIPERVQTIQGQVLFTKDVLFTVSKCGSRSAVNKSDRCGGMAPMWLLTGPLIGCIEKLQ